MENEKTIIRELQEARVDVKSIQTDIIALRVIQGQNQVILQEHMRRTEANEKHIERLENFKWYFAGIAVLMTVFLKLAEKYL